jgi:hypothetical protein
VSVLTPAAAQFLAQHGRRAREPLFSNQITAELFAASRTRGTYQVMPRTDGKFIVYDSERRAGARTVSVHDRVELAHAELLRLCPLALEEIHP